MRLMAIAGVLVALGSAGAARAQDARMGEQVFHRCAVCHEIGPGAANRQGPVLNELFGRIAGTEPGFRFSDAMVAAGQGGLIWTPETVASFIASPRHFDPATRMIFPGLSNQADIADVIAYLETFTTAEGAELKLGHALLTTYCASCHAVEKTGESPHPQAPPFRELHLRYPVEELTEALVEGLVSGHPDMPEFEFEPDQAEAIVRYLEALE